MSTNKELFSEFETKMRAAGLSAAAIRAFRHSYEALAASGTGLVPEQEIEPVKELPRLEELARTAGGTHQARSSAATLLLRTVVMKLNGGLGTSMGLEQAKSLLQVKNGLCFLDLIARQLLHLRSQDGGRLRFLLMNSFSTSRDTLEFLRRYPDLGEPAEMELLQSQVPKVDARTHKPAVWPDNPELEWCPPGHGDIYPSLLGSGLLDRLLADGFRYLFVSNSDNLGATLDCDLLAYFAESGQAFLMEVAQRTSSDLKGGHLARRGHKLLLRESAQCPEADRAAFQDIRRHQFFNTNNLWIRLDALREYLANHDGLVPLPLIKNAKTVDPRNKQSTPVLQLETAMGAAIECFENTGAIVVPRSRFSPVKTTSDLLALRSDAYELTPEWRLTLADTLQGTPPQVELDGRHYGLVDQLDEMLALGVPSLKQCRELRVKGPVRLSGRCLFRGKVTIERSADTPADLPEGEYADTTIKV